MWKYKDEYDQDSRFVFDFTGFSGDQRQTGSTATSECFSECFSECSPLVILRPHDRCIEVTVSLLFQCFTVFYSIFHLFTNTFVLFK